MRVVAVLVASPALGSILTSVLAASPALRVRCFEATKGLLAYMQLAPVDLVVLDFDSTEAPAADVALALSDAAVPPFLRPDVVALSSAASPRIQHLATGAGIAEVIVKPMSPRYLLERVRARRARRALRVAAPKRATAPAPAGDNVIPLFGDRPRPQPRGPHLAG